MLYIVRELGKYLPYNSEEGQKALEKAIQFAKDNGMYEAPTEKVYGWSAVMGRLAEETESFFVQYASDAEILTFKKTGENRKLAQFLVSMAEETEHSCKVWIEVPKKKSNAMYLKEALDYLEQYGNETKCRVLLYTPDREPGYMEISFQWREGSEAPWKTEVRGALVWFGPERSSDPEYIGYSVNT